MRQYWTEDPKIGARLSHGVRWRLPISLILRSYPVSHASRVTGVVLTGRTSPLYATAKTPPLQLPTAWGWHILTPGLGSGGCGQVKPIRVSAFSMLHRQSTCSVGSASFWNCVMTGPCDALGTAHAEVSEARSVGSTVCREQELTVD
jgi:hypothetical protein